MKILTFNVRQWSRDLNKKLPTYWITRAKGIKKLIESEDPDIILFQEMTFPMTLYIPKGYKKATGLSISHHIYCRKNFNVVWSTFKLHYAQAIIKSIPDMPAVNVFSVHSHWEEKIYKKVANKIYCNLEGYPIVNIAGGDWNTNPKAVKKLLRPLVIKSTGKITFQNYEKPEQFDELDYFAISSTLNVTDIQMIDKDLSDHKPVIINITR